MRGKLYLVFLYSSIFFPIYMFFIASNFKGFESILLVNLIQYSKELIIFGALVIWFLSQKKLVNKQWHISLLDSLFLAFLGLAFLFFLLGLGEATVVNRAIYLKNILLIGVFYFLGRNVKVPFTQWNGAFKAIFITTVLACIVIVIEKISGTHFHSISGHIDYYSFIEARDLEGTYGLGYTFEAAGGAPRYGSLFAHPLELAASMLLVGSIGLIYFISVPYRTNKYKYLFILFCTFVCLLLAYSRAAFASFFLMLGFIALLLRYYKIIGIGLVVLALIGLYVVIFSANEILYFVLDTISFQNSSSVTHLVDWLEAVDSMLSNPMGIGLAMSGNAGGVDKDLIVGGENQYLIYGVQMGFIGMFLYIGMLFFGIRNSWKAFRLSSNRQEAIVPFVAASVKFGMLLPLFTANAEAYLYISLIPWWLIGAAETIYQNSKGRGVYHQLQPGRVELSK
ncbi:MAG: O-antigen ligase family protein [Oceanospirillaceae bacterium]|nr:O-antigen ligase family protein [Oceanospirillaceae bacterium]